MTRLEEAPIRTYGNYRRPVSPGILGLGLVGTIALFVGFIAVVIMLFVVGILAAVVTVVVMLGGIGLLLVKDRYRRTALERIGTRLMWRTSLGWNKKAGKANLYRSGPTGRVPSKRNQLPGLLAPTELTEHTDSYGRPFGLLRIPATNHYVVVLACDPDGGALVDTEQVDQWVAYHGAFLAGLNNEQGVVAASVVIEAAPDTGHRLAFEVESQLLPDAPELGQSVMREIVSQRPEGSAALRTWVTITFKGRSGSGKHRNAEQMQRDLAARLPKLTYNLANTGAGAVHPATYAEVCEAVRTAYDPAAATLIDEARATGQPLDLDWGDVGPVATDASWDSYRHDSAISRVWQMVNAPAGESPATLLSNLLAPHPDIDRKRVTLLYSMIDSASAAARVQADVRNADFVVSSSKAKPTQRAIDDQAAAQAAAAEESRGAGLVNFGMLFTATVTDPERLPEATAGMDNLTGAVRLVIRPAYASQPAAFAASLPLGLVLPDHLRTPKFVRDNM